MRGYRTLTGKETLESLKTYRALIAAAVFLISGMSGPLLTYYLPTIIKSSSSSAHIRVIVLKQTAIDAVISYLGSASQLPMLVIILLAMGAIADERARGIAALVLYRPVSRAAYLLSKLTGYGLTVLTALVLGAAAAYYYTALLFPGSKAGPFLLINLGLAAIALDVLALTLLCSAALPNGITAGGASFVLYLLFGNLPRLWDPLAGSLPTAVIAHAEDLWTGAWTASDVTRPLAGGLVLAVVALAAAYAVLSRREV